VEVHNNMEIYKLWPTFLSKTNFKNELNNDYLKDIADDLQNKFQLVNKVHFFNRNRYNCFIEKKDDPEIQKLARISIRSIREYLDTTYKENSPYEVQIQGWSMVQRWGEHVVPHHHIGHHLSAVYYASVPPIENSPVRDSGAIVFHRPDPVNRSWVVRSPINPEDINFCVHVQTGDFVIFPSHLYHSVNPWFGKEPRVAFAMNIIIKREFNWEPMISESEFIQDDNKRLA